MMDQFKLKQRYFGLIKAKTFFVIQLLLMPLIIWLIYLGLNYILPQQNIAAVLSILLGITFYLVITFVFLMKDFCPWCHQKFFFKADSRIKIFSRDFFVRKKCVHCQQPTNPKLFLE